MTLPRYFCCQPFEVLCKTRHHAAAQIPYLKPKTVIVRNQVAKNIKIHMYDVQKPFGKWLN